MKNGRSSEKERKSDGERSVKPSPVESCVVLPSKGSAKKLSERWFMSGAAQGSCLLTDRAYYTKISFLIFCLVAKKSSFSRSRLGSRSPSAGPLEARSEPREVDEAPTQLEDGSKHGS